MKYHFHHLNCSLMFSIVFYFICFKNGSRISVLWPVAYYVNKVLLERGLSICFWVAYDCFHVATVEVSSGDGWTGLQFLKCLFSGPWSSFLTIRLSWFHKPSESLNHDLEDTVQGPLNSPGVFLEIILKQSGSCETYPLSLPCTNLFS